MGTTETPIQNRIRVACSKYGVCFRQQSGVFMTMYGEKVKIGIDGLSDLLFVGQGFVIFFEVKSAKGRASDAQKNFLQVMREYGHRAEIVRSPEEAVQIIQEEIKKRS